MLPDIKIPEIPDNLKLIFFNGPPGAGKDYAGVQLCEHTKKRIGIAKFAQELKERAHAFFRLLDQKTRFPVAHDYFDSVKDEPQECFMGMTPREAYIWMSEEAMKPKWGVDIFGKLLLKRLGGMIAYEEQHVPPDQRVQVIAITDSGFRPEAVPLVETFGPENCTLVRMHSDDSDFSNDSRDYIDLADLGVRCTDVHNPKSIEGGLLLALRHALPALFLEIIQP